MGSDLVYSNNKLEAGERTQQQQLQHWLHDMKTWEEISENGLEWGCNIAILFYKFKPYYLTAVGSQIAQIVACVSLKYVNSITLNSCKILTPVAEVALPTSLDIKFFCHPYVIHK
jgi:hypothetical protein